MKKRQSRILEKRSRSKMTKCHDIVLNQMTSTNTMLYTKGKGEKDNKSGHQREAKGGGQGNDLIRGRGIGYDNKGRISSQ